MVIKTREKLIDVARQLFAHKGIENTTMNDIAAAADKGRRTIYTYFKNKREIYNAVIEQESELLIKQLREVMDMPLSPVEKLAKFIEIRIEIIENSTAHHDTIRALFLRNIKRVERIRKLAISKEIEMIREIVDSGVKEGVFNPETASTIYPTMLMMFQGVDLSFLRNNFEEMGVDKATLKEKLTKFIITGIKK